MKIKFNGFPILLLIALPSLTNAETGVVLGQPSLKLDKAFYTNAQKMTRQEKIQVNADFTGEKVLYKSELVNLQRELDQLQAKKKALSDLQKKYDTNDKEFYPTVKPLDNLKKDVISKQNEINKRNEKYSDALKAYHQRFDLLQKQEKDFSIKLHELTPKVVLQNAEEGVLLPGGDIASARAEEAVEQKELKKLMNTALAVERAKTRFWFRKYQALKSGCTNHAETAIQAAASLSDQVFPGVALETPPTAGGVHAPEALPVKSDPSTVVPFDSSLPGPPAK